MASAALLPPQPLAQPATAVSQASAPVTGGLPRPGPTPVPVMTFNPPARMPPPPPSSELGPEPLTPRLPTPTLPQPGAPSEATVARLRASAGVKNAALGDQEI